MNSVADVGEARWRAGIELERSDWATLSWQELRRDLRIREWERHLSSLGLSFRAFAGTSLLDVGCGPTGLVYFVADARRRIGLDPLADQYQQWNGHWGTPADLVQAEAEAMPFQDATFDALCCVNCLDHTRDPRRVVREITRVLKPGGTLILHLDLDSPLRRLHKRLRPNVRIMHPHSLSYEWLHQQLADGFTIDRERRDPEVFRLTRSQLRYEAFWDGLFYRLTRGSTTWINHVWLRATRRGDGGS